jgi:hypothetical protein
MNQIYKEVNIMKHIFSIIGFTLIMSSPVAMAGNVSEDPVVTKHNVFIENKETKDTGSSNRGPASTSTADERSKQPSTDRKLSSETIDKKAVEEKKEEETREPREIFHHTGGLENR